MDWYTGQSLQDILPVYVEVTKCGCVVVVVGECWTNSLSNPGAFTTEP
jgi:hypothetical protein